MDSGNSGSLQSSSGDEEYDSRANSISAALMSTTHHHQQHHHPPPHPVAHHVGTISNSTSNSQQPPPGSPPLSTTNSTSSIFDPLSNYFDTQNPSSSLLNLDMNWTKALRSDPNSAEINLNPNPNAMMVSASSPIQSIFGSNQQVLQSASIPPPPVIENTSTATNTPRQATSADQNNPTHVVRNPKKRSRASRRAPTTVLTTDTTNFRAMVQEFTGIPAPPFTSSLPFARARFDLYSTSTPSSMRSNNNNNPMNSPHHQQPSYLRRPFPQKVQLPPPPFLASSSSSSSSFFNSSLVDHAAIASPNATTSATNNLTSSNTYQLPPQSANLFNFPNPILTSLLQSNNLKYMGSKPPQGLDEFGLGQGTVSGLPGLIATDQTASRNDNSLVNFGSTGVTGSNGGGDQGYQPRSAGNGKLNYTGSSSGYNNGDKVSPDSVAVAAPTTTRGEGMMESWIRSSD